MVVGFNAEAFKPDSSYIKPFNKTFSIRLFSGIKELSFKIHDTQIEDNPASKIVYKPNNSVIFGVGFSINNLLLSLTTKLPGSERNTRLFGNTSIADYQLNLTLRSIHFSVYHRNYNGFYISNSSQIDPLYENNKFRITRPDISFLTKGVESILSFNPRQYSLNASFKMTEQQVRNVWAPLIYLSLSSISIMADSSLVPSNLQTYFSYESLMRSGRYFGGAIQPGITYSLTKGNWFINPMLFVGAGYLKKELHIDGSNAIRYDKIFFRLSSRTSLGYNGRQFFTGISLDWSNSIYPDKNLSTNTSNFNIILSGGLRF